MILPSLNANNLQIVTMEAPYFTLRTNHLAREIFGKVLGTRLNAYLGDYGEGVFPLGKEDFLSELVIICIKNKSELTPIYSFKITMMDTCQKYHIPFPLLSMLKDRYEGKQEFEAIQQLINKKLEEKKRIAYFGSRSKSVELTWNKESASLLYHSGVCALVKSCEAFNIDEFMLFAMLNKDAYKYCEMLGMKKVIETPTIIDSLASSQGYVMHKTEFSKQALETATQYESFWKERIHLRPESLDLNMTA